MNFLIVIDGHFAQSWVLWAVADSRCLCSNNSWQCSTPSETQSITTTRYIAVKITNNCYSLTQHKQQHIYFHISAINLLTSSKQWTSLHCQSCREYLLLLLSPFASWCIKKKWNISNVPNVFFPTCFYIHNLFILFCITVWWCTTIIYIFWFTIWYHSVIIHKLGDFFVFTVNKYHKLKTSMTNFKLNYMIYKHT